MTNSQYQFETREEDGTLVVSRRDKFQLLKFIVLVPASLMTIFVSGPLAVREWGISIPSILQMLHEGNYDAENLLRSVADRIKIPFLVTLFSFVWLSICYECWREILNTTCIRLNEKTLVVRHFPLPRFGLRIDADEISEFYRHRIVTYGRGTRISYAVVVRLRSDATRLKADATPPTRRLVCRTWDDAEEAECLAALLGARLGIAPERAGDGLT